MQSGGFTDRARMALSLAEKTASRMRAGYVGTEHILIGLLKENAGVAARVLTENGANEAKLIEMIQDLIIPETPVLIKEREEISPRASVVLEEAHKQADRFGAEETGTEHILLALLKEGENVAVRLLNTLGISIQKLYVDTLIAMGQDANLYKEDLGKKQSRKNNKTSTLEQYSRDLTALAADGKLDPVIGRENEIKRVIEILSRRTKNNPCLIGEPGVGKTAVVEGLALRIVAGEVPFTVQNKRLLTLDLSGMVAGSKYRGEFEERIKRVVREVQEDGNVILFLDEMHTIIGAGGAEGAIDASNILKPSLARGELQLIGATTVAEYHKYVERDAALERRFQSVYVEEPSIEEAVEILKGVAPKYEEHHKVAITEEAIRAAVTLSERYINDRNLPDKAIDLIDEAAAAVRLKNMHTPENQKEILEQIRVMDEEVEQCLKEQDLEKAARIRKEQDKLIKKFERAKERNRRRQGEENFSIGENEIAEVVSSWTKVPVSKLTERESERLLKLEKILHGRVIGQEAAVSAVARAIRRGRVGLQDPNRPIGSFLFLGPTGVGKTELSKALAEAMFGSENALIRVDMSEYMEGHSVSKMIGSPPGYVGFEEGGQLSEKIRKNPYSVVLFDEIEKAHPDVFNVLLQVLDDGHITDSKGRKVSFKNTILIMTSNAGAQRIVAPKNLGFSMESTKEQDYEKMKSGVMEEVKRLFKPEFINRIDEIMVFQPLGKDEMQEIISLLCTNLIKRCKSQMEIKLSISNALKEHIVTKYADDKMGARPLRRALQSVVEDKLAEEILEGRVLPGDMVTAGYRKGQVVFDCKKR
ncbi:ATP-dependent Clp protease ATP-binding subunit [Parablautia muri]|uniref:ATP-dependent Clp protease ATP-binding subunit n=1 Tax=Parablautia muri TaxID=2320879 RepID=A0A9X5BDX5_9FIRM|nr:ATP-dependent Clp protease ATP-binding subunit [Parablautia muri]NBJ91657.1 ATP-dependent Clp protease ATP-binding subunit [Parablautia muri]